MSFTMHDKCGKFESFPMDSCESLLTHFARLTKSQVLDIETAFEIRQLNATDALIEKNESEELA